MVGNVSAGEHFLHIENVQEEDDAFYDCQIVYYFVKSRAVKVTVLGNVPSCFESFLQYTWYAPIHYTCFHN